MNLLKETIALINESDLSNIKIAKKADVSLRLIGYLASNSKRGYDVVKIQRIYDTLKQSNQ